MNSESATICVASDTTIIEATRLMRSFRVARLTVADYSASGWTPMGSVSEHDIVARVIALELDPFVMTAGDITALGDLSGVDDRRQMTPNRYVPVFAGNGGLVGFVYLGKIDANRC